jgi:hypothetical protein
MDLSKQDKRLLQQEETWTCDTCAIKNGNDKDMCIACEVPKKKAIADESVGASSNGISIREEDGVNDASEENNTSDDNNIIASSSGGMMQSISEGVKNYSISGSDKSKRRKK